MGSRPAETISAIVAALVGVITVAQGALSDGFQVDDVQTITGAVMVLVGLVAPLVTWYVARQQRDASSAVTSAADGSVVKS